MKYRRGLSVVAAVALIACGTAWRAAGAHKFHTSFAQVDFNPEARAVEITLRMFADDLEAALSRRSGKSVRIDKDKDAGRLTLAYLSDNFQIKGRDGEKKPLEWVGMEVQVDTVWAYVESKMPEGIDGADFRSSLFFELFDDQVNLVNIKQAGRRVELVFKPGDSFKKVTSD